MFTGDFKIIKIVHTQLDAKGREVIAPPVDMCENADGYCIKCDMPGLEKDEIALQLYPGKLFLQAESQLDMPPGLRVHALEFSGRLYRLTLALPPDADETRLQASYVNGVLILELPKAKRPLGRRIPVRGA